MHRSLTGATSAEHVQREQRGILNTTSHLFGLIAVSDRI